MADRPGPFLPTCPVLATATPIELVSSSSGLWPPHGQPSLLACPRPSLDCWRTQVFYLVWAPFGAHGR